MWLASYFNEERRADTGRREMGKRLKINVWLSNGFPPPKNITFEVRLNLVLDLSIPVKTAI